MTLLRANSVDWWEEGMEGEAVRIAVKVEERHFTGEENRGCREDDIKVCLCSNWNDQTGRES